MSQTALQEARLSSLDRASEQAVQARERLASLRERERLLARMVDRIERLQRLAQRWEEGLKDAAGNCPSQVGCGTCSPMPTDCWSGSGLSNSLRRRTRLRWTARKSPASGP